MRTVAFSLFLATPLCAQDGLIVFDWAGYEDPSFYAAYVETHGVVPTFGFYADDDEAFLKLNSGFRADVAHPCVQMVQRYRDAALIEPWDVSQIENYGLIDQRFLASDVLKDEAGVWYIPSEWGATAIAYNSELVAEADVQSLQVFLNPKYQGRISLPDNTDDAFALAFLATGVSDWTSASEEQFQAAAAWLREANRNVRAYWTDGAELAQLMATGEVLVAWAWNETPTTLAAEGHPIAYEREPAEGSSVWYCGYVNLKDGPGDEAKAYDFIDAWLDARTAEFIVNDWGYGHANADAMAAIASETVDAAGLGPVSVPLLAQVPMDAGLRDRMQIEFEKIKGGF
jgi:spermidine/putrescine transport system substrate-binding protein